MESQGGSVLTQGVADEAGTDAGTRPHPQPRFELTGNVERTLDPKGRLVIPAQIRARFDDGVFLLPWAGPSVALIPTDEFRKIERRLRKKQRETMSDPDAHLALTSLATHAFPDAQGRVFIPEPTRQHGHLTDELLVVGRMNRLELWQPDRVPRQAGRHDGGARGADLHGGLVIHGRLLHHHPPDPRRSVVASFLVAQMAGPFSSRLPYPGGQGAGDDRPTGPRVQGRHARV